MKIEDSLSEDPELEQSPLSGPVTSGKRTVVVHIYRLVGDPEWILEIVDEFNNSTVWDEAFATDASALTEAKKSILAETISSFIGPEDGSSDGEWQ